MVSGLESCVYAVPGMQGKQDLLGACWGHPVQGNYHVNT